MPPYPSAEASAATEGGTPFLDELDSDGQSQLRERLSELPSVAERLLQSPSGNGHDRVRLASSTMLNYRMAEVGLR